MAVGIKGGEGISRVGDTCGQIDGSGPAAANAGIVNRLPNQLVSRGARCPVRHSEIVLRLVDLVADCSHRSVVREGIHVSGLLGTGHEERLDRKGIPPASHHCGAVSSYLSHGSVRDDLSPQCRNPGRHVQVSDVGGSILGIGPTSRKEVYDSPNRVGAGTIYQLPLAYTSRGTNPTDRNGVSGQGVGRPRLSQEDQLKGSIVGV